MFFLPLLIGGGALLTAIVAGAARRRDLTTSGDAAAVGPAGDIPNATPTSPTKPANTVTVPPLPADIAGLLAAAIAGGNPATMQATADRLRAQYPEQAHQLDALIAQIKAGTATSTPSTAPKPPYATGSIEEPTYKTPGIAQGTTPASAVATAATAITTAATAAATAQTIDQAIKQAPPMVQQAIDAARNLARTAGLELSVADIYNILHGGTYSLPGKPGASVPSQTTTEPPGKALAGQLNLSLRVAKKGAKTEPIAQVKAFQLSEGIPIAAADGKYGSVVALLMAKKYGIVPAQPPMYWGKKNDYASVAQDKSSYKAALLQLAANEPQRRDEWTNAANQVK